MSPWVALRSPILSTALAALAAGGLAASEIGALHLVYEKPVKLKRVEAALYLSWPDPSARGDDPGDPGEVSCAVTPEGARGRLPARGRLRLRLLGDDGASPWESGALMEPLDERGETSFAATEIAALLGGAAADGARIELVELVFAGGRGKRVTRMTIDCIHEAAG